MCDVLWGGPGMCDKVWQGEGWSKLAKNSVTYFMDGPLEAGLMKLFLAKESLDRWKEHCLIGSWIDEIIVG